jgi:Acetyltransferase (GNAT) domain
VLADVGDAPIHLYATTYGELLYRRLGFVDRERVIRHAGTGLTDSSAPPVASVSLGAPDDAGLECLARLDAAAFGADRTPMIEAIGAQPRALLAVHREGAAAGIAWHWDDQRAIGPLSAATPDLAADLVAALARGAQRVRLDVHDSQLELGAWCTAKGLPATYEAPSLVRPGSDGVVPPPVDVTYRTLASQGFG